MCVLMVPKWTERQETQIWALNKNMNRFLFLKKGNIILFCLATLSFAWNIYLVLFMPVKI